MVLFWVLFADALDWLVLVFWGFGCGVVGFWALRCLFVVLGFRGWSLGLGWIVGFPVGWVWGMLV